ncbi:MAG: PilZ domain-containing protein [Polyangia bacterium]|mgnify:CR=1 FL=1|jgi:uncharacterized protein (TIGR02266 family)|nr:PilZ domain-containing protein [Polyangia bacterium]
MSKVENHPFRANARARTELRVRLSGKDDTGDDGLWAITRDVSKGGAFLRCDAPLTPGTRLRLTIEGSGEHDTLEVDAEVKWTSPESQPERGVGVAFLDPPAAVRRRLERMETQGELAVLDLFEDQSR